MKRGSKEDKLLSKSMRKERIKDNVVNKLKEVSAKQHGHRVEDLLN